jgi:hypothetical protein
MTFAHDLTTTIAPRPITRARHGGSARVACARTRSWTGRANMSRCTDSTVPVFVTAGTRRTRVSEMRDALRITGLRVQRETRGPAAATFERRRARGSRSGYDRSG